MNSPAALPAASVSSARPIFKPPCRWGLFAQIEAKAKHLIEAFGSQGGGFMAKTYPQPEAIDIPEANTQFMCESFKRFGKYPLTF